MKHIYKLSFWLLALLVAGCTLEKESGFNRAMQNLTAHYNILFNANELLTQRQEAYAVSFVDAYDRFLSVYQDTTAKTNTADKILEDVITKANKIISTKEQSHYLGDAYLVLGKANYLENNFYNATEFFGYVIRSFPKQRNLVQEARIWQARSLIRSGNMRLADTVLRTALDSIFPKQHNIADVYATRLQYCLYAEKYDEAETMAKQAIKYSGDSHHQLRWTFILGQLQEHNHKAADALASYERVANSNASFEMSFNASLNRIRMQEDLKGQKLSRIDALRRLLKDDKNKEFIDQIYYQIGELYLGQGNIDEALKNFKLSIRNSTANLNQKGLSYLRIADINFKNKANYKAAKNYYDSTLNSLSPNFPGYQAIFKKANNLQLLTDELLIIAQEDTLQMLAKLSNADRNAKIKTMVATQMLQQKTTFASKSFPQRTPGQNAAQSGVSSSNGNSTFYFYNSNAVSQGFTDFKRVWGNRQLADNWRRSAKSANETNNAQVAATLQSLNPNSHSDEAQPSTEDVAATKARQELEANIPLTAEQLVTSNKRILDALTEIANFYRDVLNDKKEAIATYEHILARFPNPPSKPSVYYNLYRLYSDIDPAKSDYYKNLILKNYPESNFAKVILDPDFNQKMNDKNAEFNAFYYELFDLINKRKYPEAATRSNELIAQFPNNSLIAQVYYLRAIALGHSQTAEPFVKELQEIADKFPDDRLVTPLVKQHLAFIAANKADVDQRSPVLLDSDPNEIPFMQRHIDIPQTAIYHRPIPVQKPVEPVKSVVATVTKPVTPPPATAPVTKPAEAVKEAPSIFSLRDSTNYYFVINVNNNTTSMAPSRFGIGQFNRTNLPGSTIKHQLKNVADHQLIYVGRFGSLATVRDYARAIAPLLPQIMKVPADKYNFFIITQENLDKLADKQTLDSYFDFYQKKY